MNEDEWEIANEYYRKNPPPFVIDDLGIDHPIQVPLPAKYVKDPCECGIIHKWEVPETFKLELKQMMKQYPPILCKVCVKCGDVLLLKLYKNSPPSE